jgi:hypothetical protein
MTVKTQQFYYDLLLQGYMFRLLRVIIRPSNEPTQDYIIPSALWDPVAYNRCCNSIVSTCQPYKLQCASTVYMAIFVTVLQVYKTTRYLLVDVVL